MWDQIIADSEDLFFPKQMSLIEKKQEVREL
jgi:hypothetical protein